MIEKKFERYEDSKLYRIRHSSAHIMAEAVLDKFPGAKIAIGPAIEDGYYYDFDLPRPLTPEDLIDIETRMKIIIRSNILFQYREISPEEGKLIFKDQPFKLELIDGLINGGIDEDGNQLLEKPQLSIYTQNKFIDLCRGPHVDSSSQINPEAIKLMSIAGAYWRGDERRPMLQRIYGTAWQTKEELNDYIVRLEEAKKRDHRKIGRELDLFSMNDEIGAGLVLWHPKGGLIRKIIEDFWGDEHQKSGYDFVYSPHIGRAQLWETSGHLVNYRENMYSPVDIEGMQYYLKPMNCPFHIHIYKSKMRSYREFPLRFCEKGTVYRYERSGVLHGLMRVRGFTQDDAHHFCRPDQMPEEIDFVVNFSMHILRSFGFSDIKAYLATRPDKNYVGEISLWEEATKALQDSLIRNNIPFEIDEGGGAFYGPKIDLKIKDAINREWQLTTIQFDFNLSERFDLTYIGEDGQPHRPYMIHRALLGSLERFFGVLIEHYGGAFPVWLSPVQAMLIPIADRHIDYAKKVAKDLKESGIRVEVDDRGERMNAKIRDAQNQKIPFMLVVGDKEMENDQVALRLRSGENPGPMPISKFIETALGEINTKNLNQ